MRDLISSRVGTCGNALTSTGWFSGSNGIVHTQLLDTSDFGSDSFMPSSAITIVLGYSKRDATLRANGAVGSTNTSSSNRVNVHLPFTDGTVYWDFGNATGGSGRLSAAGLSFGNDIWVFNAGSRGMEIWQNGNLRASQTGHATFTPGSGNFSLGGSAGQSSDWADYSLCYLYSTQLSQAQIQQISFNPWQIFVPPVSLRVTGGTSAPASFKPAWAFSNKLIGSSYVS